MTCVNNNSRFFRGNALRLGVSDFAIAEKRWTNEMLRVLVYSEVLKLKNVNKKGLCWQAKIARHRFAYGKAFSCCFCRYKKFNKSVLIKTLKLLYNLLVQTIFMTN